MGDGDEGEVPYQGRFCKCGCRFEEKYYPNCPHCKAVWPESVKTRSPHDGGPEMFTFKPEAVDHPAHYGGASNPYEAIKVIEAWDLDFCLGNTVKYVARAGKKFGDHELQDLKKAAWYLARRIEQLEAS